MGILIEQVEVVFRDAHGESVPVLNVPRLEVQDGRQLCLRGDSGQGKTTLLNVLAGIVLPTSGSVSYDGVDITTMNEARRDAFRARNVGYVFQTFNLLQSLSARENIQIAQYFAGIRGRAAKETARQLLERVGLGHRLDSRPGTLSVGEQQRVAIARAVVNQPGVVLADEPTANLDEANGDAVLELLKEVTSEQGSILILVTHESRVLQRFDDVVELSELLAA